MKKGQIPLQYGQKKESLPDKVFRSVYKLVARSPLRKKRSSRIRFFAASTSSLPGRLFLLPPKMTWSDG